MDIKQDEVKKIHCSYLDKYRTTQFDASMLSKELAAGPRKVIVLDDDPTGTQTVHDISVYTNWDVDSIRRGFTERENLFFIMTNSRSMTPKESESTHREIADNVMAVSNETGIDFLFISRSDSTLRGHYPLETDTLRHVMRDKGYVFDGELICPFFLEGGRYTLNDIHYIKDGKWLVPVAMTEFAKDKSFGYHHSHLGLWCEEKTGGLYRHEDMIYLPLELLHSNNVSEVEHILLNVSGGKKVIVNAANNTDIQVCVTALLRAMRKGKNFMIRSAAAIPRALCDLTPRPLLTRDEMVVSDSHYGGIIIIGSHVNLTTRQVARLRESRLPVEYIEFNQHLVLEPAKLHSESLRVSMLAEEIMKNGRTAIVCTRRDKLEVDPMNPIACMHTSNAISGALTSVVSNLNIQPQFIVSKGGITSSDVGKKGLNVTRARVIGQILPGIPVWKTGADSRFPYMPYVIFPGNVGDDDSLLQVVELLTAHNPR